VSTEHERLVSIEGTLNFRDIGGYPTRFGRIVRRHVVYRSDTLATVGDAGWEHLTELGIREIFDLRHEVELRTAPYEAPPGITATNLAIGPKEVQTEAKDVFEMLKSGDGAFDMDYMIEMYGRIFADHASVFGELLTHLADPQRLPAVFHCTAGKDRTGIAAALLLSVLGVERETVLDDYELSNEFRSSRRIEELRPRLEAEGIDVERVRPYLSAPRPALEAALTGVDVEHGGVDGFLVARAGVDEGILEALRTVLLER
jgi:protein-tyrosine phosphatase